jgi:hypothetical protein
MCEVLRTGGWYVVCKVRSIASLCWFFEMNVTKRLAFINLAVEVAASHVPESDLSDRDLMTSSHLLHNLSHHCGTTAVLNTPRGVNKHRDIR